MAADTPGTARRGPNNEVAFKMGDGVTAGAYFVIHPDHGGAYSDGKTPYDVSQWPLLAEEGSG